MKVFTLVCGFLILAVIARADTPPSSVVKAKTYSGDGATAITSTGASGALDVNVTNSGGLSTVNQGNAGSDPWVVSVTTSVLPTNASQETGGHLASIDSKLSSPMPVTGTFWQTTQPVSGTFFQSTQPVSLLTLPALTTGSATIGNVNVNGTVPVSGTFWQTTQPVSGTFWQSTQPVSAASLPLPTGAATSALQTTGNSSLTTINTTLGSPFQAGGSIGNSAFGISGTLPAFASTPTFNLGTLNGAATAAKQPSLGVAGTASTDVLTVQGIASMTALLVDGSGHTQPVSGTFWQTTQPVSAASLPLPTGAATAANQATEISSLATIATNTTNAGTPVVSGTVTVNQGTQGVGAWPVLAAQSGTWNVSQSTGSNLHVVNDAGSAVIGKVGIDQTTPGTTNLVALAANQSVNVAQINGVTPLMGNGVTGTGSQRVTIASDNTAFTVNAAPKTPTALTVKQAAVTIGTSAVRLTNDGLVPPATRVLLVAQLLSTSTANCYFGSSGVTSTSTGRGVQMFAGQTYSFTGDAGDYYAICDTATQTFFITEQE